MSSREPINLIGIESRKWLIEEPGLLGQIYETSKNTYVIEHIIILLVGESDENESCRTFWNAGER